MRGDDETPTPGQRVISDSEPELGLGTLISADGRSLVVRFEAADEERRYAAATAPLRRIRFARGDAILDHEGRRFMVDGVEQQAGLTVYRCGHELIPESAISARIALGGPRERLLAARFDPPKLFELRRAALAHAERVRRSPVRGLAGARVELLPHQFYIASEIASRRRPRVLLADQTGLGKTIEACLILHRLVLTGRARRALILVPDALVHQWLVELSRRFNLRVALFDEARCVAMEEGDPDTNPFDGEQLVLAGWSLLVESTSRAEQAAAAGWDVVVVDEAHHLGWQDGEPSPEYAAVEQVSRASAGLLLLTATPTQLGEEGHFARLRLLDPERHPAYADWRRENAGHQEVARLGAVIADDGLLEPEQVERLAAILGSPVDELRTRLGESAQRERLLADLIDRHGPGRSIFSNTRAVLSELPERNVVLTPLTAAPGAGSLGLDAGGDDPRIDHLEALLRASSDEKLLVTCREAVTARAIKQALDQRIRADIALFHEEIPLLERDRNAAWFVEPEGARMLICSEIGSEGRNFQQARHLVMYDVPVDPDLVEQRIGRIDRIGQRHDVTIDVPFVPGTGQEVLARWHHEGVGSFGHPITTAQPLLERFGHRVRALAREWDERASGEPSHDELASLIAETARTTMELERLVEEGRDRLLEMSSMRRTAADELLEQIREHDEDHGSDELFLRLLEHSQVFADQIAPRTYRFDQERLASVRFAALSRGDVTFSFDRRIALLREDFEFGSVDHPLMLDALDLLLNSEAGNASFAIQNASGPPTLLLEAIFVLEAVAPPRLHIDRFLPPTIVRLVVDQTGADCTEEAGELEHLQSGNGDWFRSRLSELRAMLGQMSRRAERMATERAVAIRERATEELQTRLGIELERLRALARTNRQIRPEEIALMQDELDEIGEQIAASRLRLEALRVIWRGAARRGVPELT